MTIFECEDSVDGIFTGIYDAWASRLGHGNVRLQTREVRTLELFSEYRTVRTDAGKAEKVARTVRRRMGTESYETIYRAALACDRERADCIYRTIVLGLSPQLCEREASEIIWHLTEPNVCRVFELSRRVGREAHRYLGFVRFRELENGVLFSEIQAENKVLPLLSDHFADRFPNENFMICDHGHRECLIHRAGESCFLLLDTQPDEGAGDRISDREEEMQRLWSGFCRSISIQSRENPGLHRQFWPLKFRKWMTENDNFC